MNFRIKEKLMLWISGIKKNLFQRWRWKIWYFWAKKLMEIYLLITEKFFFWPFREWEIRSLFEPKSWWKDDIYWLLKRSCFELFVDGKYVLFESRIWWKDDIHWLLRSSSFELFGDRKYSLFFSQKIDGKIFTWSFWAFHDIPRLRKYGFSRSDLCYRNWETRWKGPLFTNGHTSEGVNNWQFFSRYRVIVVKLKECKIK